MWPCSFINLTVSQGEKLESTCERRQQDLEKLRSQHRHVEDERDKLSIKNQDADEQLADYKKRYEYAMDEITQANKATEVSVCVAAIVCET